MQQQVIDRTRRWISSMVIGLNLCPFAERVFNGDRIRYTVTDTPDAVTLAGVISDELQFLASGDRVQIETTLVIHPRALLKFVDYNDFLNVADRLVQDLGLEGIIQIASFHPDYQFAGTAYDAVENYTNRSPYPMLHLLREESISAVATDPKTLLDIPRRNIETLGRLGIEKVREKLKAVERDP